MKTALGAVLARRFEQIQRAVGVDGEIGGGSRAAQSCEGCAAVWITSAMSLP